MPTYQIGTTVNVLVDVHVTRSEVTQEVLGRDINGAEILSAYSTVKWICENIPQEDFNLINSYYPSDGADRYIRTRVDSGSSFTYSVFSCKMSRPIVTTESALGEILKVEIVFVRCEAV